MRQYIGARYVPKFVGAWNNTTQYNALEVVDNGSGTSYIARKTVPAGTLLTNTEYWFVYGASSGAIVDLQSRMSTAENDITGIQSSILSIGGQASTNTNDITNLKTRMTTAESDISSLESKTGRSDRRIILMADSYGDYTTGSWTNYCESRLKSLYGNDNVYNITMGSRGFAYNPAVGTFEQGLAGALSGISHPETITDIYVLGGTNDAEGIRLSAISSGDLTTAITSFIAYAKTTFRNALVHIGCIGALYNSYAALRTTRSCYMGCVEYGAEYITNSECILDDSYYTDSSGLHPTTAGFALLNPLILNNILGSPIEVRSHIPSSSRSYSLDSNVSSITVAPLSITQYNNEYLYKTVGGNVVTFASPINLSSNVNVDILTYDDYKFVRGATNVELGHLPVSLIFSNGAKAIAWMNGAVNSKKLRLTFDPNKWVTISGTVSVSATNLPTTTVSSLTFMQENILDIAKLIP